ncbi:sugar ABC transporter ATP-binding protein [Anaerosporobacter sp.]|uniref:sugar ABC transporter ATP-binding protein n=1 Tax=Anaerosporobacter sp. TaxID=1872529 RepID=UPI00286EEF59|nr:sugar ABC transporter ATP-binding protein [Anaerosporobacter sp.]
MENEKNIVLSMRHIYKNFPGVAALSDVDFTLRAGEIHALMGENGAGKSTLIKVLTGVEEFETGEIHIDGKSETIINRSPQEAQKHGISTVYQEVNLCPNLSVAENIFIGREPMKFGRIDWKTMNIKAKELLDSLNIEIDVTRALENYSVAIQQMVAIARAVDISAKVLILDEPTSSLDESEIEKLFKVMNKLKAQGTGIVFVTHFLEQVYAVCDRITVLRNGTLVGEYEVENLPRVQLVAKMMGKEFDDLASIKKVNAKQTEDEQRERVIDAKRLGHVGTIKPFDLAIHKGEVIGLSGLLGSGRSELARAIYGADKADEGSLLMNGEKLVVKAPIDAMKAGMAFCPENRKEEGIIADLSVRENMILALQAKRGMFHLISKKEQEELTDKYIEILQVKTASRETPIKQLSGGNQQKVILGRWLMTNPDFLILDEPTRGIDVGTKTEIQKLVVKLAGEGMAVMFISSEIEEMLRTVNRMAILRDGRKVGELEEEELSQDNIMKAIAGGEADE